MPSIDTANSRFFWRIDFDVCGNKPRLQVTIEIWNIRTKCCFGRTVKELPPVKPHPNVRFHNSVATFAGGYLQYDLHIKAMVETLLKPIDPDLLNLLPESESLRGENVSLEAEVRPDEASNQSRFPIFFLEQEKMRSPLGGVRLVETLAGTRRGLIWSISGSDYQPRQSTFEVDPTTTDGGWHRIRVRQDITPMIEAEWGLWAYRSKRTRLLPLFSKILTWLFGPTVGYGTEFLVGGVQLGDGVPDAQGGNHRFDTGPVKLFIGGAPASNGVEAFWGDIAYLSFDPHNSCGSCTFGPVTGEGGGIKLITFRAKETTEPGSQAEQDARGGQGGLQTPTTGLEAQDGDEDV